MSSRAPALILSVLVSFSAAATAEELAELPLARVVLFNAGLGYFEHESQVTGTKTSELTFADADVNDFLKSLVLEDLGGGKINVVSLPSQSPIDERLRDFSFDLASQPTLGELLHQLRGEKVSLDQGKIEGTILGVELKEQAVGNQVVKQEVLNLLTDEGLRSITLNSIAAVKLQNEKVDRELHEALSLLASRRDSEKKSVRFSFSGNGQRLVRVGYIRPVPIWKTTYRLITHSGKQPLLQGWAIIENTGESDWNNVSLTLMSGRPVTFEMNLYGPLLVRRQELPPSIPAALASRVYSPPLRGLDFSNPDYANKAVKARPAVTSLVPDGNQARGGFGGGMGGMGGMAGGGFGGMPGGMSGGMPGGMPGGGMMPGSPDMPGMAGMLTQANASKLALNVRGTDVGEQFQYRIEFPVELARRRTAMIPIVNQPIEAERVSVFTVGGDTEFPMRALKLTNTTKIKLVQGPVTVFDEGAYAGDARLDYLPPAEHQLFNYAQDITLRVRSNISEERRILKQSKIELGVLNLEFLKSRERKYRVENRSEEARRLILEQPRSDQIWRPTRSDRVLETTDTYHRFEIPVPASKTIEYVVGEQSTEKERHDLDKISTQQMEQLFSLKLADDVTAVLTSIRDLRNRAAEIDNALQLDQLSLAAISSEQDRIRENMATLTRDSELYKSYVAKMTDQEAKLDVVQEKILQHHAQRAQVLQQLQSTLGFVRPNPAEDPFK